MLGPGSKGDAVLWMQEHLAREFPAYSADIWGITSSDGPSGYQTWGGPPRTGHLDGSVVPCAAAGSLMFTPDLCLPALHAMKTGFGGPSLSTLWFS